MDTFERVNQAAVEGLVTRTDTLSPLLAEVVADAKTEYTRAACELHEAQRRLAEHLADDRRSGGEHASD